MFDETASLTIPKHARRDHPKIPKKTMLKMILTVLIVEPSPFLPRGIIVQTRIFA